MHELEIVLDTAVKYYIRVKKRNNFSFLALLKRKAKKKNRKVFHRSLFGRIEKQESEKIS